MKVKFELEKAWEVGRIRYAYISNQKATEALVVVRMDDGQWIDKEGRVYEFDWREGIMRQVQ